MTTTETIIAALYELLSPIPDFVTTGRRLVLWNQCPNQPALFLNHISDDYPPPSVSGGPIKLVIEVDVWIYSNVGPDPESLTDTPLSNLVEAVKTTLRPAPIATRQTLDGLVYHCWIEGKVMYDQGYIDGQGKAVIPVRILVP